MLCPCSTLASGRATLLPHGVTAEDQANAIESLTHCGFKTSESGAYIYPAKTPPNYLCGQPASSSPPVGEEMSR